MGGHGEEGLTTRGPVVPPQDSVEFSTLFQSTFISNLDDLRESKPFTRPNTIPDRHHALALALATALVGVVRLILSASSSQ